MNQRKLRKSREDLYVAASLAAAMLLSTLGCTNRREDCTWLATCITSAGGADDSESWGGASGRTSDPCNGTCGGATPHCNTESRTCAACTSNDHCLTEKRICSASGACVECLNDGQCSGSRHFCSAGSSTCVECRNNNDCASPLKSVCDPSSLTCVACQSDENCAHVSGKNVCLVGEAGESNRCVECTSKSTRDCVDATGAATVCNSLEHICTSKPPESADSCEPCVADAECKSGMLCHEQLFDGASVGYFCFQKSGDPAGGGATCERPYGRIELKASSIDGAVADLCTLRVSTCPALNMFADSKYACAEDGIPNDALCGFAGGIDSRCLATAPGQTTYECSMACLSDDDCLKLVNVGCDKGTRMCTLW